MTSISVHANGVITCRTLFSNEPKSLNSLIKLDNWQVDIQSIKKATDPRLKQSLRIYDKNNRELPSQATNYKMAQFLEQIKPVNPLPTGATLITDVEFGYDLGMRFQKIGRLNYIILDKQKTVIEVGGSSKLLLKEFRNHIFGRTLSQLELDKINRINEKLLTYLQTLPEAQRKLKDFSDKRGWPKGLAEKAKLTYFGENIYEDGGAFSVISWARSKENNDVFSETMRDSDRLELMRDAGWLQLKFNYNNEPFYITEAQDSIRIPFFEYNNNGKLTVPVWRSRILKPFIGGNKYSSWPTNRSLNRVLTVSESLYNGYRLNEVEGKTVVVTEGEFKCLVATETTGILHVGIPGITQMTDTIIEALVKAKAKEIIIVLDRDSGAKRLMRVDKITDSERAAYTIAQQLRMAGAENVKIGVLPDAFDGRKVGIDDLILAKGNEPYLKTLNEASTIEDYAQKISLDTILNDLYLKRQKLRKSITEYENSILHNSNKVNDSEIKNARKELKHLETTYSTYLAQKYHTQTITQPSSDFPFIPRVKPTFEKAIAINNKKSQIRSAEELLSESNFKGDILFIDYTTRDRDALACKPMPCKSIDILTNDVSENTLENILSYNFPKDEFQFEMNFKLSDTIIAPLLIYKKDTHNVVAIARLQTKASEPTDSINLFQDLKTILRNPNH